MVTTRKNSMTEEVGLSAPTPASMKIIQSRHVLLHRLITLGCIQYNKKDAWWHHDSLYITTHRLHVDSPHRGSVKWTFDVSFDVSLSKLLDKQSNGWWFERSRRLCCVTVLEYRNKISHKIHSMQDPHWQFMRPLLLRGINLDQGMET